MTAVRIGVVHEPITVNNEHVERRTGTGSYGPLII